MIKYYFNNFDDIAMYSETGPEQEVAGGEYDLSLWKPLTLTLLEGEMESWEDFTNDPRTWILDAGMDPDECAIWNCETEEYEPVAVWLGEVDPTPTPTIPVTYHLTDDNHLFISMLAPHGVEYEPRTVALAPGEYDGLIYEIVLGYANQYRAEVAQAMGAEVKIAVWDSAEHAWNDGDA